MKNQRKLKIRAHQFAACDSITSNLEAIKRGIEKAADQNVRLMLTQVCALSGYPPIERASIDGINQSLQNEAINGLLRLAKLNDIYIALGMVIFCGPNANNSIHLLCPDGKSLTPYHKRALWGWDKDHFQPGNEPGIYVVDGFTIGTCICYEVRFPEFFRELFINQVDLALISFADVGKPEQSSKFKVIQSHIVSRAAENVFYVLTANSISQHQLASTGLVDPDGNIIDTAPLKEEFLLTAEIEITRPDFGRQGRISNSKALLK